MTEPETRQHILDIAIRLISQRGFANIGMNDIVRESGVSKGGVYWHFKSKDEIIYAIFDFFLNVQLQLAETMLSGEGSASEKLRRIFQVGASEAEAEMPPPLEFYALAARDPVLRERMGGYFEAYRTRVSELLQQGIDEGEFAACDTHLTAINVVSFLEGVVLLGLSIPRLGNFQSQLNNAIDLMLNGLRKRE